MISFVLFHRNKNYVTLLRIYYAYKFQQAICTSVISDHVKEILNGPYAST